MRRLLLAAATITAALAFFVPGAATAQTGRVTHQLPIAASVVHDVVATANWSGYVNTPPAGHHVTAVHTAFVVPQTQTRTPGGPSTWAGIGGFHSNDLIQAGVEEGNLGAPGAYYAWYELLPDAETLLTGCTGDTNCTVNPGNTIRVDIVQKSKSLWSLGLTDVGHWTFVKQLTYSSTGSSADWILEAPTAPFLVVETTTVMPFMGNTTFGPGNTYSLDGHSPQRLGKGAPTEVDMFLGGLLPEAAPSAIAADGDGFTGCTFQGTCPRPAK